MTFTLSAIERRTLIDSLAGDSNYLVVMADQPEDPYWLRVEEALDEILTARAKKDWPTRGNRDYLLHGRPTDTQANERHLTPLPIAEQIPGAWNFVEPPPAHMGAGWQRATGNRGRSW